MVTSDYCYPLWFPILSIRNPPCPHVSYTACVLNSFFPLDIRYVHMYPSYASMHQYVTKSGYLRLWLPIMIPHSFHQKSDMPSCVLNRMCPKQFLSIRYPRCPHVSFVCLDAPVCNQIWLPRIMVTHYGYLRLWLSIMVTNSFH